MRRGRIERGVMHPWFTKQIREFITESAMGGFVESEIIHVQAEAGIVGDVEHFVHIVHARGFAIGRHTHHLVFAIIHPKTQKGSKGGVKQTQRMREFLLMEEFNGVALLGARDTVGSLFPNGRSFTNRRRGPFTHTIYRENGSFFIR